MFGRNLSECVCFSPAKAKKARENCAPRIDLGDFTISGFDRITTMNGESASPETVIIDFAGVKSSSAVDLTNQIHQLPCCIKYNGPSQVSHYFKPKSTGVEVDGLDVKEAHFRGRKLQGTTVQLPDGYSGFVIGRKKCVKRKASDTNGRMTASWQTNAKFQNITLWNHDNLPSKEDAFLRVFHWFDVANALHKPVTVEDMESASNPGGTATD